LTIFIYVLNLKLEINKRTIITKDLDKVEKVEKEEKVEKRGIKYNNI
jgi:hypothetical protein